MRILIAPLEWGLGHATRCVPIIRYLMEKGCEVVIGADGSPLHLLQKEFPFLEFVVMPGYNISYPKNGSMILKMVSQIPKILSGIKREHEQLQEIIQKKKIDAVISDNRFGLWSKEIPCVFITHQVMVKSLFGENLIHRLNKNYIGKYSECWVPDYDGENGLSGDLAHTSSLPRNGKYIGVLSRFEFHLPSLQGREKYNLLVVLSGPEPQRTVFENKIIHSLSNPFPKGEDLKVFIVQGITEKNERKKISENVEIVSYLTSDELQKKILSSEIILSRPGYSTIMDLAIMRKKAIFVPTPGQTEQEYLAGYFSEKKIAYSVSQKKFDLNVALKESEKYNGFTDIYSGNDFMIAVDLFLSDKSEQSTQRN